VFNSRGQLLGTIPTAIHIQNFAFTGRDRRTLYAVGRGNVYKIEMLSRGLKSRQK
jgi:gluconolactonase